MRIGLVRQNIFTNESYICVYKLLVCVHARMSVHVSVCAYEHTRAREYMYAHITMRNAFKYISLWLSPICDFNWLDIAHLNIYHFFFTSDVFYTNVYFFYYCP